MTSDMSRTLLRAATALDLQSRGRPYRAEWIGDLVVALQEKDASSRWRSPLALARVLQTLSPSVLITVGDLRSAVVGFAERLRARCECDAAESMRICLEMHALEPCALGHGVLPMD